ncbi:MAG: DNA topoisomerase 4 subunit A [Archaeoglobaceae archaeon]|nr:DNA topoisomerase 4 subunit A [Archaeoglobaceae archaeon]
MELVKDVAEELKNSYISYAMSVIVGRAIPDVRDGLKPVQRRILYAMYEMGLRSDRPYKKCARIVGEVLGKYHPHGDAAVYDSLVRMAQEFSMRYPLVDGQGNFGSLDGDEAAAMRYTEARLTKIAELMLEDIDKNTVDFVSNFDCTLKEPSVLPSKIPNLLINGSSGIAVGMATNIPPHNLKEVCDAIVFYIKNPNCSVDDLLNYIKGPDFPTGGIVLRDEALKDAYRTGRGRIVLRGKVEVEDGKRVVIKEIPFTVNKARLVEEIVKLAKEVDEIRSVRDESNKEGIRIVLELKAGSNAEKVVRKLYRSTDLQITFGIINLALVNGEPKILNLKEMIEHFVEQRREVVRRRTLHELEKTKERLHLLFGLKEILKNIDYTIEIIKNSKTPGEAKKNLIEFYKLDERQADAVLQMRLQKITALEIEEISRELEELTGRVEKLENTLKSLDSVLISELEEIKNSFGDDRRTEISDEFDDLELLMVLEDGTIKTLPLDELKDVSLRVSAATFGKKDRIFVFTNKRVLKVKDRVRLEKDEKITSVVCAKDDDVVVAFPKRLEKFKLSDLENKRFDEIVDAAVLNKKILVATVDGYTRVIDSSNLPAEFEEKIVSLDCGDGELMVTVTEKGFIKRSEISRRKALAHKLNDKTGRLIAAKFCRKEIVIFGEDKILKIESEKIPVQSRNSIGKPLFGQIKFLITV